MRTLAAYADHTDCRLATLAFAAGVDLDHLLEKTRLAPSFGQSPFAFHRGLVFEQLLRNKNYAAVIELLRTEMAFPVADARIVNLRDAYPKTSVGMQVRAQDTLSQLRLIVRRDPAAPNLIDGAVFQASIGGMPAFFEADALAMRSSGELYGAEVKSFPRVDDRIDRDKLASALDQVALYLLLVRQLVSQLGGDPNRLVSDRALLITPKNVGLTPTLSQKEIKPRIDRVQKLLASVPRVEDVAAATPAGLSFGPAADTGSDENRRLTSLQVLADKVGTAFKESCLSNCGNARFCRERAFKIGSPCLIGSAGPRMLPGVPTLERAADLSRSAPAASPEEQPVAERLEHAGRLYDELTSRPRARRNA